MKKRSIIAVLLLTALLMQFCKKSDSSDSTTDTTTAILFNTYVNGSLWTPKTVSATLIYNATAKTKTFTCTATDTAGKSQVILYLTQPASAVDSTLTVQAYADTTYCKPKYFLVTNGVSTSVAPLKAASISITGYDAAKKLITGTFAFNQSKINYDSNGNSTGLTSYAVSAGQFNNLPFTFKKQ